MYTLETSIKEIDSRTFKEQCGLGESYNLRQVTCPDNLESLIGVVPLGLSFILP